MATPRSPLVTSGPTSSYERRSNESMPAGRDEEHGNAYELAQMSDNGPLMEPSHPTSKPPLESKHEIIHTRPSPEPWSQDTRPNKANVSLYQAFGWKSTLVLSLGTFLLLVLLVAFLGFFWFVPHTNTYWRRVAESNLMPRIVTLTTTVMSTIIGYQVIACSSMIVTLYWQRGVQFRDAATMSLARQAGNAIWRLLYTPRLAPAVTWLILPALIALTSTASQFASTLLVGDLAPAQILSPDQSISVVANLDSFYRQLQYGNAFWNPDDPFVTNSLTYATFAEFADPSSQRTIADTGPVLRAILPEPNSSNRESLQSYEGPALVYDSRVFCTAPRLENMQLTGAADQGTMVLNGTAFVQETIPELVFNNNTTGTPFWCAAPHIPNPGLLSGEDHGAVICAMQQYTGGLISNLTPQFNQSMDWYYQCFENRGDNSCLRGTWRTPQRPDYPFAGIGRSYLVLSFDNVTWDNASDPTYLLWDINNAWNYAQDGPWTVITPQNNTATTVDLTKRIQHDFTISASLCFDATGVQKMIPIRASRPIENIVPEPKTLADGMQQMDLNQLERADPRSRAVLDLDSSSVQDFVRTNHSPSSTSWYANNNWYDIYPWWFQWNGAQQTDNYGYFTAPYVSRVYSIQNIQTQSGGLPVSVTRRDLFLRTMNYTSSPALALQAQQHMVLSPSLYYWLPAVVHGSESSIQDHIIISNAMPAANSGYFSVLAIVLLHITVVTVITVLFARADEKTFLDRNAWQTIAQLMTPDTKDIMAQAVHLDDASVEKLMQKTGKATRVAVFGEGDGHDGNEGWVIKWKAD